MFISVAATFPVPISFAVSAKFSVSGFLFLMISYSLPATLLASVFASVCLSGWRSRVAAVQNLLVQHVIEWLAGRLRYCVLPVPVSATLVVSVSIAVFESVSLPAPVLVSTALASV